jgi:hypothetical protein
MISGPGLKTAGTRGFVPGEDCAELLRKKRRSAIENNTAPATPRAGIREFMIKVLRRDQFIG